MVPVCLRYCPLPPRGTGPCRGTCAHGDWGAPGIQRAGLGTLLSSPSAQDAHRVTCLTSTVPSWGV